MRVKQERNAERVARPVFEHRLAAEEGGCLVIADTELGQHLPGADPEISCRVLGPRRLFSAPAPIADLEIERKPCQLVGERSAQEERNVLAAILPSTSDPRKPMTGFARRRPFLTKARAQHQFSRATTVDGTDAGARHSAGAAAAVTCSPSTPACRDRARSRRRARSRGPRPACYVPKGRVSIHMRSGSPRSRRVRAASADRISANDARDVGATRAPPETISRTNAVTSSTPRRAADKSRRARAPSPRRSRSANRDLVRGPS